MAEHVLQPTLCSRKRAYDSIQDVMSSEGKHESEETHLPTPTSSTSSPASDGKASSPEMANSNVQHLDIARVRSSLDAQGTGPGADDRAAKRPKLTFAEKEVERAVKASEKEAREHQKTIREQERQRKAEEKEYLRKQREAERAEKDRAREADRQAKEAEKAEKDKTKEAERQAKEEARRLKEAEKKVKDAEKQAKEEAKRKREEEKSKHEKSQLRLGSFFGRTRSSGTREHSGSPQPRATSSESHVRDNEDKDCDQSSFSTPKKAIPKEHFLPFFARPYVHLAPANHFTKEQEAESVAGVNLDKYLHGGELSVAGEIMPLFRTKRRRRYPPPVSPIKQTLDRLQETMSDAASTNRAASLSQLSQTPYKILSFAEDVRPPYMGTYTRAVSPASAMKISRKPFRRQLPDKDYDYDSEAEWEPPNEDDEDLGSGDDEDDMDDEADDDMEGFLDDDDDDRGSRAGGRKKQIYAGGGDLEPISSGLCWTNCNDEKGPLEQYRMQSLFEHHDFPIDPFSACYWSKPRNAATAASTGSLSSSVSTAHPSTTSTAQAKMPPPARLPLSHLNPHHATNGTCAPSTVSQELSAFAAPTGLVSSGSQVTSSSSGKPHKFVPDDLLPAFKSAIEGSDMTKAGLVEVLKKQYVCWLPAPLKKRRFNPSTAAPTHSIDFLYHLHQISLTPAYLGFSSSPLLHSQHWIWLI